MSHQDALVRSWSRNAEAWTRTVRGGGIESRRLVTDAAIVRAVLERRPERVLDLGCGEGWLARALAEQGIDVVGIDVSPELVDAARREGGGEFHAVSYDALAGDPSLARGEYDAVVCNFSLLDEHPVPLLAALRSVLRPGGALVIQTVHPWIAAGEGPYQDGWRTETFTAFGEGFAAPMPWYFRTLESWTDVLAAAGYSLADLREPLHPNTGRPASLILTCMMQMTLLPGKSAV
ncbi:MAG TPA: class I SAM-dependent methyltransferase [Longimicrobium sp.]|uniref:class I SAM-dependent methyltransferase n=1 Tax=Longimicrobium sp. TaxID=2029185 RepID=UPI002EDA762B